MGSHADPQTPLCSGANHRASMGIRTLCVPGQPMPFPRHMPSIRISCPDVNRQVSVLVLPYGSEQEYNTGAWSFENFSGLFPRNGTLGMAMIKELR